MKTIVILEDDTVFRESVTEAIKRVDGLTSIGAFSRIKDLMKELPDMYPDLFWLDISLPDGSSIEYIPKIKQMYPHTLCLVCSMHDDDDRIFSALKVGADGYLLKNSGIDKMIDGVHELFAGGSPMSPFIARKVLQSMREPENEAGNIFKDLTSREVEILSGLAQGFLYKEVADRHNISLETVKKHTQNIYRKLHVQNRSEAIIKYLKGTAR
jgi:two-component system, NarL family, response regulator LiaR